MYDIEVEKKMENEQEALKEILVEERLSVYLMMLKIMPNLHGYNFIKECTKLILIDSTYKFNIHSRLFNVVGEMFGVKAEIVDRSLRHAIEVSINLNGISDFEKFMKLEFYNSKPSPRELLCVLAERAKVESNRLYADRLNVCKRWEDMKIV